MIYAYEDNDQIHLQMGAHTISTHNTEDCHRFAEELYVARIVGCGMCDWGLGAVEMNVRNGKLVQLTLVTQAHASEELLRLYHREFLGTITVGVAEGLAADLVRLAEKIDLVRGVPRYDERRKQLKLQVLQHEMYCVQEEMNELRERMFSIIDQMVEIGG